MQQQVSEIVAMYIAGPWLLGTGAFRGTRGSAGLGVASIDRSRTIEGLGRINFLLRVRLDPWFPTTIVLRTAPLLTVAARGVLKCDRRVVDGWSPTQRDQPRLRLPIM